jgi:hypothetical protein
MRSKTKNNKKKPPPGEDHGHTTQASQHKLLIASQTIFDRPRVGHIEYFLLNVPVGKGVYEGGGGLVAEEIQIREKALVADAGGVAVGKGVEKGFGAGGECLWSVCSRGAV